MKKAKTLIAILLAAAKILCEIREELCGDVRLLFQPAEEELGSATIIRPLSSGWSRS